MYWDELEDLLAYWGEFPPSHVLVRAAVGFKPPTSTVDDVREIAMAGGF